ncbi:MAG: DUF885 domain-containing protein [Fidelibacterota bacterium]
MTPGKQLDDLVERFCDDYFQFNPTQGRELGIRDYYGRVPDLSFENIMGFLKRLQFYEIEVNRLLEEELSPQEKADLIQLNVIIASERFNIQQLRWWAEDPHGYGRHLDVSPYLKRRYAPLRTRAEQTITHLNQVPYLLEQQRFNLVPEQPRVNLATTLEGYRGHSDFYRKDVVAGFSRVRDSGIKETLSRAASAAAEAVDSFISYAEQELVPNATGDFAMGRFNFIDMLKYGEMVEMGLDELLRIGESDLRRNQREFQEVAAAFMPGKGSRDVMMEIARDHPSPETLVEETEKMLEGIRQFLIDNDIVTVPSDERIVVAETPRFMRWAFAMCDTPGPFETRAKESFYYVTNVDPGWSEKQKEEWLTKFDYATLDNVSVHEAYPGHYVHFLHTLSAPSKMAKIAGSYAFWEGWAHYAEQMMMEEGWHQDEPRYRLAQLSEALVRNCRYLCSIRMHTRGMTVDEATRFFMENAFMAETPARKEAERGTFDPGYLNYTLGKLMILKLREDWKRQEGNNYSLKRFHDTFLSFGAPPIPLVRQLMLKEGVEKIL